MLTTGCYHADMCYIQCFSSWDFTWGHKVSGLEPKEQWLCIPHSEQGGCPGIQTRGEKTHKNDNKLRLDFSSASILQRKKALSAQQISSSSHVGYSFLPFIDWIGKLGAFILRALAHAWCFIDELHVNFIMHLKTSRSPKEMRFSEVIRFQTCKEYYTRFIRMKTTHNSAVLFRSNPFCFYCSHSAAYCHCTLGVTATFCRPYSYFSKLLSFLLS